MILLVVLVRTAVAVVFLRAGLLKLVNVTEFKQAVHNYRLLPQRYVALVSYGVLVVELVGGGMLLLGVELRPVGIALAGVLALLSGAISVNLLRGRIISCGCSGSVAGDISWRHVCGNGALAGAAVLVAVWAAEPLSVLPGLSDVYRNVAWTDRAIAVILLLALGAVVGLLGSETRRARRALRRCTREGVSS